MTRSSNEGQAEAIIAAARGKRGSALDELTSKKLLACYGVQVPKSVLVIHASEVPATLRKLRLPVVVKVMSPDILHKSDVGGVKVGLASVAAVKQAMRAMAEAPEIQRARIEGFLIEEMAPAGQEVVVGAVKDPQFGPLIMVGLGGIFVEVLADVTFRICPISLLDAQDMLAELKGAAVLKGARNKKPVSQEAIIDVLLKVGGGNGLLMRHAADICEADINPLIVSSKGAVAVDARFILA